MSAEPVSEKANSVQEFSTELLAVYYGRMFPYDAMFNWLSYGNDPNRNSDVMDKDYFLRREWSFTIQDDIYLRYQSFKDKEEMMAMIQKRQPHKIDIGAVFTASPKEHANIKPELFKTVERELVFDIDMTDYDDIRTCCKGASICHRCWPYMTMALKTVDQALRVDFAFKHILWVYSGRRGIHCWVCDPAARQLSNEARTAVVDYLTVHTGSGENSDKKIKTSFTNPHPMMRRAYQTLEPYFSQFIADGAGQGLMATHDSYTKVLNTLPNEVIRKELYEAWKRDSSLSGADRWRQLRNAITSPFESNTATATATAAKKRKNINYVELDAWRYELVFTHCYPRLDANVSKAQNHLLKSPFCVHPKTGRVCIPIDPQEADSFDPFTVPTVRSLCEEVDNYERTHTMSNEDSPSTSSNNNVSDSDKTSLKTSLEVFDRTFMKGLNSTIRAEFRDKSERMAAVNMDF